MDQDMELKLNMLATLQKTFRELYKDDEIGILGIGSDCLHMREDAFRAAFPDAVEEKPYTEDYNIMETEYNGVKFIALTDREHENVQMS